MIRILDVAGNANVVGVLTVGSSSITIDGSSDELKVGTGVTITHSNGIFVGETRVHSGGITAHDINTTGIITAAQFSGYRWIVSNRYYFCWNTR